MQEAPQVQSHCPQLLAGIGGQRGMADVTTNDRRGLCLGMRPPQLRARRTTRRALPTVYNHASAQLPLHGRRPLRLPATTTSAGYLIVSYLVFGIGMGMVNAPITNSAVSGMPREQAGVAAGIASASRQVG